jgi:hypothetical protein
MNRALPAPPRPRQARPLFRWPSLRRSTTTVALIRTEPVVVTPAEFRALEANPDVQIIHARPYGPGRAKLMVRYPDRAAPHNRPPAVRVEGGTRAALIFAAILGAPAALAVAGYLIWHLFADTITAAAQVVATVGGGIIVALVILWLLFAKAGVCPGLHCPGCPHR